jgi:ribosomal protein L11 methyltransferase
MGPQNLRQTICDIFENRQVRVTPSDLERCLRKSHAGLSQKAARSAIKKMVAEGILLYTHHFNTTHLELNFCRPLRVSRRIILSPPGHHCGAGSEETHMIMLHHGSAFGIGDHPTTRLVLRAMDSFMATACAYALPGGGIRVLDIGTGSGVLAMAAVKLGAEKVVALDVDPLALHEARNNIDLNAMDQTIVLTADPLEDLLGIEFDLIMANLRPPTLREMLPLVEKLSSEKSRWIFSGVREEALKDVDEMLPGPIARILNKEVACGWAAMSIEYTKSPKIQTE